MVRCKEEWKELLDSPVKQASSIATTTTRKRTWMWRTRTTRRRVRSTAGVDAPSCIKPASSPGLVEGHNPKVALDAFAAVVKMEQEPGEW